MGRICGGMWVWLQILMPLMEEGWGSCDSPEKPHLLAGWSVLELHSRFPKLRMRPRGAGEATPRG